MLDVAGTTERPRCAACGELIARKKRRGDDAMLYCTRECAYAEQKRKAAERLALKRAGIRAGRELRELARQLARPTHRTYTCKQCAEAVNVPVTRKGSWASLCPTCRADNQQAHKRRSHARRKARLRGATVADLIDPLAILRAQGWFCAVCYQATPPTKRGTTAYNAPELDHIQPLALGGAHVAGNLQGVCRRCNQAKGGRALSNADLLLELTNP